MQLPFEPPSYSQTGNRSYITYEHIKPFFFFEATSFDGKKIGLCIYCLMKCHQLSYPQSIYSLIFYPQLRFKVCNIMLIDSTTYFSSISLVPLMYVLVRTYVRKLTNDGRANQTRVSEIYN